MSKYCLWRGENELMQIYHDTQYGVVKKHTNILFKYLILEMMQAGLSWQTIINKQQDYDAFFNDYDVIKIAALDFDSTFEKIKDTKMIKNKLKVKAIISNAKLVCEIQKEEEFFDYLISLIDVDKTLDQNINDVVKEMKKLGFKFIGFEIIKSFYESVGIINNHIPSCIFYKDPLFLLKQKEEI